MSACNVAPGSSPVEPNFDLGFEVSGTTLTLTVINNNTTTQINEIDFNYSGAGPISLTGNPDTWTAGIPPASPPSCDGMGSFDVRLMNGSPILAMTSAVFTFIVPGGTTSSEFTGSLSGTPAPQCTGGSPGCSVCLNVQASGGGGASSFCGTDDI